MTVERTAKHLEQTFEDERRYLVNGELNRLARLAKRKETLLAALAGANLENAMLERFAHLSDRNEKLLVAARDGLQSAGARLADIQRGVPASTYSATGAKSEMSRPVRTLQRRA